MHKPLNIGHRGAMGHETQNTVPAIKKALAMGVDRIEIDVFVIKIKFLSTTNTVVIHFGYGVKRVVV